MIPMALTMINQGTVLQWLQDPGMVSSLSGCLGLPAQTMKQSTKKKRGCGRCGAARKTTEVDANAILKCLAHMGPEQKAILKTRLGADKVRVLYTRQKGLGKEVVQVTY